MSILAQVTSLGGRGVSCKLLIESWQSRGGICDDVFFLHFDILFNYRFLKKDNDTKMSSTESEMAMAGKDGFNLSSKYNQSSVVSWEALRDMETAPDYLVSISDEGMEFLHRFG